MINAAITLVTEQGSAAVALSEIAEAADVGRKAAYAQFGDRDTLLLEAAIDLLRRELLPEISVLPPGRARAIASSRHFAGHRSFYRAILTSASASRLGVAVGELFLPHTRERLRYLFADVDDQLVSDVAVQLHGGMIAALTNWLVDGDDPLDAESFTDRLLRVQYFLVPAGALDDDTQRPK